MDSYMQDIERFQQETAGYSAREEGVYRRMLDIYYATERPLILRREMLYSAVRCAGLADRAAVDKVIHEHWKETPTGWILKRDRIAGVGIFFHFTVGASVLSSDSLFGGSR